MFGINWNKDAILKAVQGTGSLTIQDVGLPVVDGRFILPPYIEHEGGIYRLTNVNRPGEPYKNVVRINQQNSQNYSYVPDENVPGPKAQEIQAQTEGYNYAMAHKNATFQKALQNSGNETAKEDEEILDIDFTKKDNVVIDAIEGIVSYYQNPEAMSSRSNYFAKGLERFFRAIEQNSEDGAFHVERLRNVLKIGVETDNLLREAQLELKAILNTSLQNTFTTSLHATHLYELISYKRLSYSTKVSEKELDIFRRNLETVNRLLNRNVTVHNTGARLSEDSYHFSKSLAVNPIIKRAVSIIGKATKKKNVKCYEDFHDYDFSDSPGYSPIAAQELNSFFDEADDLSITIDNKPADISDVFGCSKRTKIAASKIEISNGKVGKKIVIHYGNPSQKGMSPDLLSSVLRTSPSKLDAALALSSVFTSSYILFSDLNTILSSTKANEKFITIEDESKERQVVLSLDYSEKAAHNHRGELGQIFTSFIRHTMEAGVATPGTTVEARAKMSDLQEYAAQLRDEVEKILYREGIKGRNISETYHLEKVLASSLPILTALKKGIEPSPENLNKINAAYLRYYGLLNGIVKNGEDESIVESFYDQNGFIPETFSRFTTSLYAFALKGMQRNGTLNPKVKIETDYQKDTGIISEDRSLSVVSDLLAEISDTNNESPSLMQRILADLANGKQLQKAKVQEYSKELKAVLSPYFEGFDKVAQDIFGGKLKKEKFLDHISTDMLMGLSKANVSSKFFEKLVSLAMAGDYLNHMQHTHTFSLVELGAQPLFGGAGMAANHENPAELLKEILVDTRIHGGMGYKLVATANDGKSMALFNSKRGYKSSSGIIDYGIDHVKFNDDGSIKIFTDVFEYKLTKNNTGILIPHTNDGVTFSRAAMQNFVELLGRAAPNASRVMLGVVTSSRLALLERKLINVLNLTSLSILTMMN